MDTNLKTEPERDSDAAKVGDMTAGMGEDITLRVEAEVDGKEVLNKEGDSLLMGFANQLRQQMKGGGAERRAVTYNTQDGLYVLEVWDTSAPMRLSVYKDDYEPSIGAYGDIIHIKDGGALEADGPFYVVNSDSLGYYDDNGDNGWIEINEATFDSSKDRYVDSGVGYSNSGYSLPQDTADIEGLDTRGGLNRWKNTLMNLSIVLGKDSTSVDLGDRRINNVNEANLEYTGTSKPAPVVSTNEAELTFTKDVSNNTGSSIQFREIGLRQNENQMDGSGSSGWRPSYKSLIARDVIDVTVPDGSTATFRYSILVDCSGSGGVMAQFLELLYRHTASTNREAPDIDNNNRNTGRGAWDFCLTYGKPDETVAKGGGKLSYSREIGLMVGTGTSQVSNTDFALENRLLHGDESGQLWHFGVTVSEMQEDHSAGRAYFPVERIFENRTNSDITINEVGLYCGATDNSHPDHRHLIVRNVLDSPITIGAGKLKKLYYEVGIKI